MNRVRNTRAGFGADFAVVTISCVYCRAGWASCAVTWYTCIVLADIAKLAVTNIAAAVFALTCCGVAVLVKVAMNCRTTIAGRYTNTARCISRVTNFAFCAVLITKAWWSRLTRPEIVAFVTSAESKLTSIVCGALAGGRWNIASLTCRAFRIV